MSQWFKDLERRVRALGGQRIRTRGGHGRYRIPGYGDITLPLHGQHDGRRRKNIEAFVKRAEAVFDAQRTYEEAKLDGLAEPEAVAATESQSRDGEAAGGPTDDSRLISNAGPGRDEVRAAEVGAVALGGGTATDIRAGSEAEGRSVAAPGRCDTGETTMTTDTDEEAPVTPSKYTPKAGHFRCTYTGCGREFKYPQNLGRHTAVAHSNGQRKPRLKFEKVARPSEAAPAGAAARPGRNATLPVSGQMSDLLDGLRSLVSNTERENTMLRAENARLQGVVDRLGQVFSVAKGERKR